MIDHRLLFYDHLEYITNKTRTIFQSLRRYTYKNWGSIAKLQNSLRVIYDRAIIPILSYALNIWGHRLSVMSFRIKLRSMQGTVLRCVLGAYATVPTETACVLAQRPPLHLALQGIKTIQELKKRGRANFLGTEIVAAEFTYWVAVKLHVSNLILGTWQQEWSNCTKGRCTFELIPDIQNWCEMVPTPLERKTVMLLSGHGEMGLHLRRIGKADTSHCEECQLPDTPKHSPSAENLLKAEMR